LEPLSAPLATFYSILHGFVIHKAGIQTHDCLMAKFILLRKYMKQVEQDRMLWGGRVGKTQNAGDGKKG
jgi:hypothetical protein